METITYTFAAGSAVTLTGGTGAFLIALILAALIFIKPFRKSINNSPVLWMVAAWFTFGFVGWLIWWAVFEMIDASTDNDEEKPKKKKKAPKMPKTKKPKEAPPAQAPQEEKEEKIYI